MISSVTADFQQADIREQLAPLWARKLLIAAIVVLSTIATYAFYTSQPKVYTASTQLFLNPSQVETLITGVASAPGSDRAAGNIAELARTRAVAELAAEKLPDNRTPAEILAAVSVAAKPGSDFILVSSNDQDPARAAATANAFTDAFARSRTQGFRSQVSEAVTQTRRQLAALGSSSSPQREAVKDRLARLTGFLAAPSGDVRQLDPAAVPQAPVSPTPVRNAIFAAAISLVLAIFAAYGLTRFDLRIRHLSDIQAAYAVPVLAAIPRLTPTRSGNPTSADPAAQEPLRSLQTSLRLASLDSAIKTILVTSAVPGEGKSTLVRNLALVQRDEGARVVIVEADLRRPVLRSWFKLNSNEGLTDMLAGQTTLADALQRVAPDPAVAVSEDKSGTVATLARTGELSILTSGPTPANPSVVLATEHTAQLIKDLGESFTYVLIDAPPLLPVSDALPLLGLVDGVIIVSRLGITQRAAAKRLMELLGRVPDANILGVVANDVVADELYGTYVYAYTAPKRRRSEA